MSSPPWGAVVALCEHLPPLWLSPGTGGRMAVCAGECHLESEPVHL